MWCAVTALPSDKESNAKVLWYLEAIQLKAASDLENSAVDVEIIILFQNPSDKSEEIYLFVPSYVKNDSLCENRSIIEDSNSYFRNLFYNKTKEESFIKYKKKFYEEKNTYSIDILKKPTKLDSLNWGEYEIYSSDFKQIKVVDSKDNIKAWPDCDNNAGEFEAISSFTRFTINLPSLGQSKNGMLSFKFRVNRPKHVSIIHNDCGLMYSVYGPSAVASEIWRDVNNIDESTNKSGLNIEELKKISLEKIKETYPILEKIVHDLIIYTDSKDTELVVNNNDVLCAPFSIPLEGRSARSGWYFTPEKLNFSLYVNAKYKYSIPRTI